MSRRGSLVVEPKDEPANNINNNNNQASSALKAYQEGQKQQLHSSNYTQACQWVSIYIILLNNYYKKQFILFYYFIKEMRVVNEVAPHKLNNVYEINSFMFLFRLPSNHHIWSPKLLHYHQKRYL